MGMFIASGKLKCGAPVTGSGYYNLKVALLLKTHLVFTEVLTLWPALEAFSIWGEGWDEMRWAYKLIGTLIQCYLTCGS